MHDERNLIVGLSINGLVFATDDGCGIIGTWSKHCLMTENSSEGIVTMSNDARRLYTWLLTLGATSPEFAISKRAFLRSIDDVMGDGIAPITRQQFCSAWRSLRAAGLVHLQRSAVWADR